MQTIIQNLENIEQLIDKSGNVNAAILRSKNFKDSLVYKKIFQMSKQLDVFEGITISERINFIYNKLEIDHCRICGKPFIEFKKSQTTYSLCRHKKRVKCNLSSVKHQKNEDVKHDFLISLQNRSLLLSNEQYSKCLDELVQKKFNYAFLISKQYFDFYHDLVLKTGFIAFDENDFKLPERIYCEQHVIHEIPKCKYCGKETYFLNRKIGYAGSCVQCQNFKSNDTRSKENRSEIFKKIDNSKYEIVQIPNLLNKDELVVKCKKCGMTSNWLINNGRLENLDKMFLCRHCENNVSAPEEELYNFILENTSEEVIHKSNSRKIIWPKEIDIYLPERKLGIEFDGLYWHSTAHGCGENSQIEKMNLCNEKGIHLIRIFEDEWMSKTDIVKSRILDNLGKYSSVVFARKCIVREVDGNTAKNFENSNHLQGSCNSKINVCLKFNDEIVSLMTFGKCRFDKKHEWELLRFCNKLGFHVPGAASKMLKYFEKTYKPKNLVSYADRRWSQGKLYYALGFSLDHASKPNYWYLNFKKYNCRRLPRYDFQKHKLKDKLNMFDDSKSEWENMKANGYDKIYDCGNLVFVKNY